MSVLSYLCTGATIVRPIIETVQGHKENIQITSNKWKQTEKSLYEITAQITL